ncbi:MAG: hypothetical protein AAF745_00130 [Planctomycetota bacterium]
MVTTTSTDVQQPSQVTVAMRRPNIPDRQVTHGLMAQHVSGMQTSALVVLHVQGS